MNFDIIVIGGGLVGASLVVALKDSGLKIALIEPHVSVPLPRDASWDSRVYAISPGSALFLQGLGIWQLLDVDRLAPVYEMAVFGDDNSAHINFSAYEIGLSELAFIAENRQLQTAVWDVLKSSNENIHIYCPAKCTSIVWEESHVEVQLEGGNRLQAALVVGADGVNSWVRKQADIDVSRHSYNQVGVVANFNAELSHRQIAHQWFRRDGVLAL